MTYTCFPCRDQYIFGEGAVAIDLVGKHLFEVIRGIMHLYLSTSGCGLG